MAERGEITELLRQADGGDEDAVGRLFQMVEGELQAIAHQCKNALRVGDELQTTMLVDDAFVKLVAQDENEWEPGDRKKFFGFMAKRIHDLLVDFHRKERALKRGGDQQRRELDDGLVGGRVDPLELELDLREALAELERFSKDDETVFRLRHVLGCTFADIADVMGMPETTVQRTHRRARAWLSARLKEYRDDS